MKRGRDQPTVQKTQYHIKVFSMLLTPAVLPCESKKDEDGLLPHPNNLYNLPSCFSSIILYWFSSSFPNLPPALSPLWIILRSLSLSLLGITHIHTPADVATPNRFGAPSTWSTALFYFQYNTSQSCMLMAYCFCRLSLYKMHCAAVLLSEVLIAVCCARITHSWSCSWQK